MGRLASAALLLSASFVLSRLLGVIRMSVIADVFGNSPTVNAYFAAFRIPDTMFTLVSGGALASAFIPVFAGLVEKRDERQAWAVASSVLNSIALALAAMAALAFVFAPQIMGFLVNGHAHGPCNGFTTAQVGLTVSLTRIMLLQPIFLGLAAIVTSVLQTYHRFALTAIAPLLYNLSVIGGALAGKAAGIEALAWAVVLGAAAQLLIQLPGLIPEARRFLLELNWGLPASREVLRLFIPRVIGLGAFQAMLFITLYLAARLPCGMVGAINYSWLLISFPVGALGTAAATAIFPTLSRLTAAEDLRAVAQTVNRSLRLVLFLAIPAAAGLIVLRRPIVNLLYFRGEWTAADTEQTAFALLFYALALAPLTAIEVLPRVFYAMRDTISPVRIALVAVTVDAVLSVVLVHWLPRASGQGGLALATAIASAAQAIWLAIALNGRLRGLGFDSLRRAIADATIASLVMALVLYDALDPLTAIFAQHGVGAFFTVAVEIVLGGATFAAVAYLRASPELWQVRGMFLGRYERL
jgi:putative peptidoglycan lipid II flippase